MPAMAECLVKAQPRKVPRLSTSAPGAGGLHSIFLPLGSGGRRVGYERYRTHRLNCIPKQGNINALREFIPPSLDTSFICRSPVSVFLEEKTRSISIERFHLQSRTHLE